MISIGTAVSAESPPTSKPPHIVWDWNGTLLNDNHAVLDGVNAVCAQFGRRPVTLGQWRSMFRRPLTGCYQELLDRPLSGPEWELLDRSYHEAYRQQLHTCGLAADATYALRTWRAGGGSQSLLSMWFHRELVPLVSDFGLWEFFERVDGLRARTGGGSKSAHLAEHLAAQHRDPRDVVVIGDVTDDAEAATVVGARCVLVTTGMMSRGALARSGAPVVDSLSQALEAASPAGI